MPVVTLVRLPGDRRGVPLSGDRRSGAAAAEGGPPDGDHEHQTGAGAQDLCSDQYAQGLIASLSLALSHTHTHTVNGLTQ